MIKNIFEKAVSDEIINRIELLTSSSSPQWGKMSVDQMLAHCNVAYRYAFHPEEFKKPNAFKKFLLKTIIKGFITNDKPYSKNGPTAPDFVITATKDFEKEKQILIDYINKTQQFGTNHFEGLENISFGKMTANEWSNLFYKHLDHHLKQFGV